MVWPPIEGRQYLREIHAHGIALSSRAQGEWSGTAGPWHLYLAAGGHYANVDDGHQELLAWAHWHALLRSAFSPKRCLVLGTAPDGSAVLWQAVHREPTLADGLARTFAEGNAEAAVGALFDAAWTLQGLHDKVAPTGIRVTVENTGCIQSLGAYTALAPTPRGIQRRPATFTPRPLVVEEALSPLLDGRLRHWRRRSNDLLRAVQTNSSVAVSNPEMSQRIQDFVTLL